MATTENVGITRLAEERFDAAEKKALARARRRRMGKGYISGPKTDPVVYKELMKSECQFVFWYLGMSEAIAVDVFGQLKRYFLLSEEGRAAFKPKFSKARSTERIALRREVQVALLEREEEDRQSVYDLLADVEGDIDFGLLDDEPDDDYRDPGYYDRFM